MNSVALNIDCMDYMASMPDKHFDLAVVDPPYGASDAIGLTDNKNKSKQAASRKQYKQFENIAPNQKYWDELIRISKHQIIWGANFFGFKGGYICWNKYGTAFGQAELAYCSKINSVRVFEYTWNGMLQENMKNKESRIHPTQKPIALYQWIYKNYLPEGGKVIDTHLGSGSNRIAADKAGNIDFVGCELDKDYFEAQEKRWKEYKAQLNLFV